LFDVRLPAGKTVFSHPLLVSELAAALPVTRHLVDNGFEVAHEEFRHLFFALGEYFFLRHPQSIKSFVWALQVFK
jgi:hypothetical protein